MTKYNYSHSPRLAFLIVYIVGLSLLSGMAYAKPKPTVKMDATEKRYISKGDDELKKGHLFKALQAYTKVLADNPVNCYANFQVGVIYYLTDSVKVSALPYLENAIKLTPPGADSLTDAYYYIGFCDMLLNKYDKATNAFSIYRSHLSGKADAERLAEVDHLLNMCRMAPGLLSKPNDSVAYNITGKLQQIYIKNMGRQGKSFLPEYTQLVVDDEILAKMRPLNPGNKSDKIYNYFFQETYLTHKDTGATWYYKDLFMKQIRSKSVKKGVPTFQLSADGQTFYVFKNGNIVEPQKNSKKAPKGPKDGSKIVGKLRRFFLTSSFISSDGNTLMLVSDAPGGRGGLDIYMCTKDPSGKWSDPVNLGPNINTAEDEDAPFLTPDGNTLFFSSKGHGGLGGYDIFVSHLVNGTWTVPQNLGAPINSPADDIFFNYNPATQRGYLSSSRVSGSFNDMDIFTFAFDCDNMDYVKLQGKVIAETSGSSTEKPSHIQITDLNPTHNRDANVPVTITEIGEYSADLVPEHKYRIDLTYPGYVNNSAIFNTPHQCSPYYLYQALCLSRIKDSSATAPTGEQLVMKQGFFRSAAYEGYKDARKDVDLSAMINANHDTGVIHEYDTLLTTMYSKTQKDSLFTPSVMASMNVPKTIPSSIIYFKLNSFVVGDAYNPFLNSVAALMKGNKKMRLQLYGYTDDIGAPDYNKRLSLLRAKSVGKYLTGKGVRRGRLKIKSFGANNFIAPNDGTHNPLNRRVEVRFVSK